MKLINIPNFLTLSRFVLTLVILQILFGKFLKINEIVRISIVVVLYIIAAVTDYYDGHFARKYKERTEFGSFMDSFVDKIFTLSIFYSFLWIDSINIHSYLIYIITFREVLITLLRIVMILKKRPMITEKHGKLKTALQIIAQSFVWAVMLIFCIIYETSAFQQFSHLSNQFIWDIPASEFERFFVEYLQTGSIFFIIESIPNFFVSIVAVFTVYSGVLYLIKNRSAFCRV